MSCALLAVAAMSKPASAGVVEIRRELEPLSMNHSDLVEFVNVVTTHASKLGGEVAFFSASLGDGVTSIRVDDASDVGVLTAAPDWCSEFRLALRFNDPSMTVNVELGDFSRRIEVSGEDPVFVRSFVALLAEELSGSGIIVGGSSHRALFGVAAVSILLLMSTVYPLSSRCDAMPPGRWFAYVLCANVLVLLLLRGPNWGYLLPGFEVRATGYSKFGTILHLLAITASLITVLGAIAFVTRKLNSRAGISTSRLEG